MVDITQRCIAILDLICTNAGFITANSLAREAGVSERTVRYDLKTCRRWLEERGISLRAIPRKGFAVADEDKPAVLALLAAYRRVRQSGRGRFLNADERAQRLIGDVLEGRRIAQFDEAFDRTGVSRSTYARDLDRVAAWFESHGAALARGQKHGMHLKAPESIIRRLTVDYLLESIDNRNLVKLISVCDFSQGLELNLSNLPIVNDILQPKRIGCIIDKMDYGFEALNIKLRDDDYLWLLLYTAVMVYRINGGHSIEEAPSPDKERYKADADVCSYVEMCFNEYALGKEIPSKQRGTEVQFIAYFLKALSNFKVDTCTSPNRENALRIGDYVVDKVYSQFGYSFTDEPDLADQLKRHLQAALVRMQLDNVIANPILQQTHRQFPQYFEGCREIFDAIESTFNISFNDNEIGYVVMYVAALVERRQKHLQTIRPHIRMALVCGHGIGTLTFLSDSLRREFPSIDIVEKLSVFDAIGHDFTNVDFVLTTIDLPIPISRPMIKVSPILSRLDIRRIGMLLSSTPKVGYASGQFEMDELMRIISSHCNVIDEKGLRKNLSEILDGKDADADIVALVDFPNLADVVKRRCTVARIAAHTWEDAVRFAAGVLYDNGFARDSFLKDVLHMKEEYGQWAVIPGGICLPHAFPQQNFGLAMTLISLEEPVSVDFNGYPMEFSLVMALSTPKAELQSKALDQLFCLLDEYPDMVGDLQRARFSTELYRKFRGYCNRLFS